MTTTYIPTSKLPAVVQNALENVGYHRKDIGVNARESVSIACSGGDGYRGFAVIINLGTGERQFLYGSWGGANPWNPTNRVDLDTQEHTIPVNGCVILGSEGGSRPVYASVYVRPDAIVAMLPPAVDATEDEKRVLYAYRGLKSGPYRKEFLDKIPNVTKIVDDLVARGLLKRAKNGATQITTEGRNVPTANYY